MPIPQPPKTLVMPLQNGTQKDLKLGPDFRRDDDKGKVRDDDYSWAGFALSPNGNKELQPLAFYSWGVSTPLLLSG